ncbi:hypothetical protein DCCM_0728 [Desulfocucumis palustris]|uniref:Uncharacterized protein n=1 Tax=Desulfocucumis palustris TaxID=1898651 RepID=A0A2L2X936_9FIRM|nr:hypothetical protein DCCM_0728 [Desulfocucumis palustris]
MLKIHYTYKGEKMTLSTLYKELLKKPGKESARTQGVTL